MGSVRPSVRKGLLIETFQNISIDFNHDSCNNKEKCLLKAGYYNLEGILNMKIFVSLRFDF